MGADVLKIEQPRSGDPARQRGPFPKDVPHPERSGLFLYLNTSKRSITLDLTMETGREIFRRLVADVDVLIEDCAPGELDKLGLGYEELAQLNSQLVMTSITPFGQTGPHRDYRLQHLNLYHCGGHSTRFYVPEGGEARPPARGGGYLGEYDAGLTAVVGTMGAVLGRAASGRGQHVDVSKQEALMCLERVDIGRLTNDAAPPPWRPLIKGLPKAKDGYFILTPTANHQWQALIRAMGNPEWAQAEWCQSEVGRLDHSEEVQAHIEEWAGQLTRDEIYHRAQGEGAPVGVILNVEEVMSREQMEAREYFVELEHPEAGKQRYPSAPHRFSETPWSAEPAPLLGQHNEEVYCDGLGYSHQELVRLAATGVI
jgi:crotonobetainyl-CoA:carnitine CoA-transferase CaiB-like acyl-CoA transferase